nr:asparagine synthase (glutamine-hydrolyzing) [Lachnospiraceae bacterium]
MCGIAGFCNLRDRDKQRNIAAMLDRIVHRGPDSSGTFYSENGLVTFGHRRLSIIDVTETGSQPMTSHNGRYVLTYNGEIYNHQELKKRLIEDPGSGVSASDFRGSSDSEILLEAISSYGIKDTLTFCRGMFAFAVYDKEEDTVILARDRMGEKPLYYGKAGGAFAFASDISSLKAIEGFDNEINRSVLPMYFMNGYISAPYTIFKDIFKLEPGCMLTIKAPFDLRNAVITTYYDLKDAAIRGISKPFNGSFTEAADELERLLKSSVKGQMISDVPLGAFLSAGTDSSTVVSIMQSISDQTVRSFTIGMSDPKYNEAEAASAIASHLGTEHTELYITEDDAKKVIPDIPRMFTEPFADSSQIPTYLVSKMTREHVTVSLSGDGGDELFNGYDRYPVFKGSWDRIRKYPYPVRSILGDLLANNTYDPSSDKYVRGRMLKAKGAGDLYNISRELDGGALNIVADDKRALNNNDTLDPRFLKDPYRQLML